MKFYPKEFALELYGLDDCLSEPPAFSWFSGQGLCLAQKSLAGDRVSSVLAEATEAQHDENVPLLIRPCLTKERKLTCM